MSIKITKKESSDVINNTIITPSYGTIKIVENINYNNYTHFDSINEYDLFINNNADNVIAIKSESLKENEFINNINNEINKVKDKYKISNVEYLESDNAILIKNEDNQLLDKIGNDYKNDKNFYPTRITSNVLFLEPINNNMQLEDASVLDKLSDQDMKNVINKAGIKLNGNENKERLKGIIQGALTSTSKI